MKNDKIYCKNCRSISIDIHDCIEQNTRLGKFKSMCPYCLSTNTVNVYIVKLQYEEYNRRGYLTLDNENDDFYKNLDKLHKDIQKALFIFKRFPKHLNSIKDKI